MQSSPFNRSLLYHSTETLSPSPTRDQGTVSSLGTHRALVASSGLHSKHPLIALRTPRTKDSLPLKRWPSRLPRGQTDTGDPKQPSWRQGPRLRLLQANGDTITTLEDPPHSLSPADKARSTCGRTARQTVNIKALNRWEELGIHSFFPAT